LSGPFCRRGSRERRSSRLCAWASSARPTGCSRRIQDIQSLERTFQPHGGHIAHALFGRRLGDKIGSVALWTLLLLAVFVRPGLTMWAVIVFFIAGTAGAPLNDLTPLPRARRWLGYAALVVLVLFLRRCRIHSGQLLASTAHICDRESPSQCCSRLRSIGQATARGPKLCSTSYSGVGDRTSNVYIWLDAPQVKAARGAF
jgi:hypothetical protein